MPNCRLDHLAIAATTLEQGADWLEGKLGVRVPEGGTHPNMGTHNRLMRLGSGCFVEVIAIDPQAPAPDRPRWFTLDEAETRTRLAAGPALLTWVARTDDIEAAVAASPMPRDCIAEGRRGDLVWRITIPHDGSMPGGGLFPTLIQWPESLGPDGAAPMMAELGCRLERLTIRHPDPEQFRAALTAIGADALADIEQADAANPPGLSVLIECPNGMVEIG